jgi:hypothetical protein
MGLLEDLGAWLDQKRRNVASSVQNPGLLYDRMNEDARQFQQDQRANWGDIKSVVPEVKAAGIKEFNASGQEMAGMAPAGLLGWTAWHGSPHKFDKFDLSKIGSGEGSQAYGHGLYYADKQDVANSYANMASNPARRQAGLTKAGADDAVIDSLIVLNAKKYTGGDVGKLAELIKSRPQAFAQADKLLQRIPEYVENAPPAFMYKVDISDAKAPQDAFLQWDKPLSEQPKRVQDAMRKLGARPTDTGEQAYLYLQTKAPGLGAQDRYGQPIKRAKDYAGGLMREAGIPGIRYLDAGSRGAGSGTMNTVLFDDSLVKILERNGVPVEQPGLLAREPTKFQLAHAEAQRNAALPVAQGGLGLGPQNTAAERMKALGFDTDAYHGGVGDITAFDKEWRGATTGAPSAKKAHFAATSPKVATGYSLLPEDRSVVALQRQQAQAEASKNWDKQEELTQKIEDLVYGKRNQINKLSEDRFAAEKGFGNELDKYGVQLDYYSHRPEFGDYTQEGELLAKNALYKDAFERAAKRVPTGEKDIAAAIEAALGKKAFSWDTVDEYKALLAELQKKDAKLADYYAAMHDDRWMKMPEFQPDPQQLGSLESAYQNARGVNNELNSLFVPEGANVMPLVVNTKGFDVKDFRGSHYRDESYNELITKANIHKKPGVVMQNTFDPGSKQYNEPTGILAIMDPTRIRSRFAAFDPKKKDSRDLLASMGLLGLLGAGAYGNEQ